MNDLEKWTEALRPYLSKDQEEYLLAALPRYRADLKFISSLNANGKLLEIGSYPYCMTFFLKSLGFEVIGLDQKVSRGSGLIKQKEIRIFECDIETQKFPFESESFDIIVFNEVIEHLRINPLATLSEIKRCLKVDGLLMLTTPNLYGVMMVKRFITGKGIEDPVSAYRMLETTGHMGHLRTFAKHDVENMLHESGFVPHRFHYRPIYTGNRQKIFRKKLIYKIIPSCLHDNLVFSFKKTEKPN